MSEVKSGWGSPLPITPEQLSKSQQAQRDQIIKDFQAQHAELLTQIGEAHLELDAVKNDIAKVHQARQDQYKASEVAISKELQTLNAQAERNRADLTEILNDRKSFEAYMKNENQKLANDSAALMAREDQLQALQKDLEKQQKEQNYLVQINTERSVSLDKRKVELDQFKADSDRVMADIIDKRHQLAADIEEYQKHFDDFNNKVVEHNQEYARLMQLKDALEAQEKALDPLKKQLQDGIEENEKEKQRLMDANISAYQKKIDAESRLEAALDAERRAKAQNDILMGLKQDIHEKIKQEA